MGKIVYTQCRIDGCEGGTSNSKKGGKFLSHGYCRNHYHRLRKYGDPLGKYEKTVKCKIEGCNGHGRASGAKKLIIFPNGYCDHHNYKFKMYGDPLSDSKRKKRVEKCSVEGCDIDGKFSKKDGKTYFFKGLCRKHYFNLIRRGGVYVEPKKKEVLPLKKCKVEGCEKTEYIKDGRRYGLIRGMCPIHYWRVKVYNNTEHKRVYIQKEKKVCIVDGCESIVAAKGLCSKHRGRLINNGDVNKVKAVVGEDRNKNPLYFLYTNIKTRCYNKKCKAYKYYGGRGIVMCSDWLGHTGFNNFLRDMGERPSIKHSVERIENDKGYCGDNCRWATINEQAINKRNNSKYVGVFKGGDKWQARLSVFGKEYRSKMMSLEDAIEYRKQLELKYINNAS